MQVRCHTNHVEVHQLRIADVLIANGRDVPLETLLAAKGPLSDARRWCHEADTRRHQGARIAPRGPDLQAAADRLRARQRLASVRRGRARVSRPRVGHRRGVARARPSGPGRGDCRPGLDADPRVEPLLPPAAGRSGGAAHAALGPGARLLRQQRRRSRRRLPEVRAALLVHPGHHLAHRVRGDRGRICGTHDGRAVRHVGRRALPRAVPAAARTGDLRRIGRHRGARGGGHRSHRGRSSPNRSRAKAASGRCRASSRRRSPASAGAPGRS